MTASVPGDVTRLLQRLEAGDRQSVEDLLPLVYPELRAIADGYLKGERVGHTLQPTALVNEAWLRLARNANRDWQDRRHFFRAAAAVMRCILVNHARDRQRQKRGGAAKRVPLDADLIAYEERAIDLIALDDALRKLEELDPRHADLIELRFFAGLSAKETADLLGVSERTMQANSPGIARAWLLRELDAA